MSLFNHWIYTQIFMNSFAYLFFFSLMTEILYTCIYICTLTHRKVNHFEKFQLVKFFSNAGELWISQEKQTPQTDETFMKIKSNRYCANSLIFKDNFHEKVCWTSLLACNHQKQLEHAYFNSLAFILNILHVLSNHFEAYTIVFKSQIIFFCKYFSLM